jgi:hypothetical protein
MQALNIIIRQNIVNRKERVLSADVQDSLSSVISITATGNNSPLGRKLFSNPVIVAAVIEVDIEILTEKFSFRYYEKNVH